MLRHPVQVRDATPDDAEALLTLWADFCRRGLIDNALPAPPEAEAAAAVARIAASADERLLVAEVHGKLVGLCHLVRSPMSPVHTETATHLTHLHVVDHARRHGVGRALVEAMLSWAEDKQTTHVLAAAAVHSRDANRFFARLGLAQVAVIRRATVSSLRARLPVDPPAAARVTRRTHRSVGQVIAQRRSMRRAQARPD